ncbi:MAG: hypothetical protein ACRD8W_30770 [Nitrososphaeraceae archaeon]
MNEDSRYNAILMELSKEYGNLMGKYAPKLHSASHEDNKGIKLSHVEMVRKIQQDCIHICTDNAMKITFSGAGEEELIGEILEYNYDEADVEHMIKVEKISLFSHLRVLNKYCIKRTDPEWFQFGIHELLQNGKVNPGALGSKRTQFCKCCGDQIYIK